MRIAINALSVQSGGGLTFLKNLLKNLLLLDQKNEYVVLTTEAKASALGLSNSGQSNLRTIIYVMRGWVVRSCWEQTVLPLLLRREGVNVLYAPGNQGPVLFPFPFVVFVQNVDPLVLESYGTTASFRIKRRLLRMMMRASVKQAKKVVAVSAYARRLLVREFGCPFEKITVIPHGSPVDAAGCLSLGGQAPALSGRLQLDGSYFLAVSNMTYNKNYETLLRALSIALPRIPEPATLVVAGKAEEVSYYSSLEGLVRQLGLSENVHFLGGVDRKTLRVLYAGARALIFPSRVESFGLPLLEAMAFGVPVAASRIEPIVEVCGDAVLYFDPENHQEMAKSMVRILQDSRLRKTLVERGLARAKLFSWEGTARQTLQILEEAVSRG